MSVSFRFSAVIAVCTAALTLCGADKSIFSLEKLEKPNVILGKVWRNGDTVKATLPTQFFTSPLTLKPGKTYTLTAEIRSTGDAPTPGKLSVGFITVNEKGSQLLSSSFSRLVPELAVVAKDVNPPDMSIPVKGNLESWEQLSNIPLALCIGAKEDCSDLPNSKTIMTKAQWMRKTGKGEWQVLLVKPIQKGIKAGTKLGVNYYGNLHDAALPKAAETEWTTYTFTYKPGEKQNVSVCVFSISSSGEIEIRKLSVVENN